MSEKTEKQGTAEALTDAEIVEMWGKIVTKKYSAYDLKRLTNQAKLASALLMALKDVERTANPCWADNGRNITPATRLAEVLVIARSALTRATQGAV